jgi:transposase
VSDPSRELLESENEALRAVNTAQAAEIERLSRTVAELTKRLDKSSKNSSLPPSSDPPKHRAEATKTRADRRAEVKAQRQGEVDRRRGKQPGAPGANLPMSAIPDQIVEHSPTSCGGCGVDLAGASEEGFERRQVFDTPHPVLVTTEHRALRRRCSCGHLTTGVFPKEARATTCYGSNIRAAALYLLHGQHLSVERTAEAMSTMLGAPVSTGFIASLVAEAAGGLNGFMDEVKRRLITSVVAHADETPAQVRTDIWWLHVVSNELFTYLFASPTRGKSAPDEVGILPAFSGTLVHDRLAMYFNYDQATHAICLAHIERELTSVAIRFDQTEWATAMITLLGEMNCAAHQARDAGRSALPRRQLSGFMTRYDAIVQQGLIVNPDPMGCKRDYIERESFNLVSALQKLKPEATLFAHDLRVPFTNNEGERSLRMSKLQRKISGCFQGDDGARHFAIIRSYLATARKHNVGALDVLAQLFNGHAWMPPITT